jgi:hypothetical protein
MEPAVSSGSVADTAAGGCLGSLQQGDFVQGCLHFPQDNPMSLPSPNNINLKWQNASAALGDCFV